MLLGDFNAHNIWWGSNLTDRSGRMLEEVIDNSQLILLNNGANTHFNAYNGAFSAIDLSFASPSLATRFEWSCCNDLHQSDHYPIILESSRTQVIGSMPIKYDVKNADWVKFASIFPLLTLTGDLNADVNKFTKEIIYAADRSIPKKGGILLRPRVPWWTAECKAANTKKKKALNKFKRHPTPNNLEDFKRSRAKEKYVIKCAKKESLKAYISKINSSTDTSEVWNILKSFSNGRNIPLTPNLVEGTEIISRPKEVAESLAHYFGNVSKCSQYSNTFLHHKRQVEQVKLDFDTIETYNYNLPFSDCELEHALKKTKDSSPGPDNVHYIMIKKLPPWGKSYLLKIYNYIWEKGSYPDCWREAFVIPILKDGKDPSIPSSYRPISLTSCISKIFESMVNERLVYVMESEGWISNYQAGFRKLHSTMDHLCNLEISIQEAFKRREHTLVVFFDLEKAYDTTWRYNILQKCHKWGLRGNLPKIVQSFLEERFFRVRVGTSLSQLHFQENGTPQGSVLSVTCFNIAINNIADKVNEPVKKSLYVDDLAFFISGNDIEEMARLLQAAINEVSNEADRNGFKFSATKSVCMHFCRQRREHITPTLFLNGSTLECKDNVRFLGITFDSKLSWKQHINQTAINCKRSLKIIKFLSSYKWNLDRNLLLKVFISLTRSRMEYGISVYGSARKSNLAILDRIYNQGLRYVTGAFRTSPLSSLYVEAKVMPPELRRKQLLTTFAAGLWGKYDHFLFPRFFEEMDEEFYKSHPTYTRPINVRNMEILQNDRIHFGAVEKLGVA